MLEVCAVGAVKYNLCVCMLEVCAWQSVIFLKAIVRPYIGYYISNAVTGRKPCK